MAIYYGSSIMDMMAMNARAHDLYGKHKHLYIRNFHGEFPANRPRYHQSTHKLRLTSTRKHSWNFLQVVSNLAICKQFGHLPEQDRILESVLNPSTLQQLDFQMCHALGFMVPYLEMVIPSC